jgi:hypothetical protein
MSPVGCTRYRVAVIESEDGAVRFEYRGEPLVARAFPKDARVDQAAVVDNKLLSGALLAIQAKQRERDEDRSKQRKMTLREEDNLLKDRGEAGLETRRSKAKRAPMSSAGFPTTKPTGTWRASTTAALELPMALDPDRTKAALIRSSLAVSSSAVTPPQELPAATMRAASKFPA